ncbi:MAG TPA: cysteine--tRNA ligase [Polyangiaceae bacterium]|jgi:cysteinyl-tRNA synthetase|nr:cysteine--tRNA ligase [Polyangiaceae bacterium]
MASPFRIYNTLSRKVEDFVPIEPGRLRLYICGMTVYAHWHVGHLRMFMVFDAFVRYLRHRGWEVQFVRNFTDVDDKIINTAAQRGEDPFALAQHYIDCFHADAASLGLIEPNREPRVSETIDSIVALIQTLIDRGHAYVAEGNVWFDVRTDDDYGKLSNQKIDELRNPDDWAGKRDPADFALWKAAKPGEPSWPSPWGPGRPGWHIECSAMAQATLGDTIDIHGGGLDLVFPHHENEIAQSECATGKPFVNYWMHNGLLTMGTGRKMKGAGEKMAKSVGNVVNVQDALTEYPTEALRLYYLQNHYRSPLPWTDEALADALGMLSRLYEAREKAETMEGDEDAARVAKELGDDAQKVLELGKSFPERFYAALDQDFNSAQALGHAFELARALNRFAAHKKAKKRGKPVVAPALAAFHSMADALAILAMPSAEFHREVKQKRLSALGLDEAEIERLIGERSEARKQKDWARADAIRNDLVQKGIEVLDLSDGVEWRVRLYAEE